MFSLSFDSMTPFFVTDVADAAPVRAAHAAQGVAFRAGAVILQIASYWKFPLVQLDLSLESTSLPSTPFPSSSDVWPSPLVTGPDGGCTLCPRACGQLARRLSRLRLRHLLCASAAGVFVYPYVYCLYTYVYGWMSFMAVEMLYCSFL